MSNTTNPIASDAQGPDPSDPQAPSAGIKHSPSWLVLLAIGTETQQYIRLEIKNQLTIGCTDPETGISPDVDLNPLGVQHLGVSARHVALFAAQGGLHIRDLASRNGTTLNGFGLDGYKLYKLHQGDVIELGQLRIEVQIVRLITTFGSPYGAESAVNGNPSNAVPDTMTPFIASVQSFSDEGNVPTEPSTNATTPDLEYYVELTRTEPEPAPLSEVSSAPQPSLASNWKPTAWIALLLIDAQVPQYLALEVTGQLTIGYTDSESGVAPDVDLGPFGARDLGLSRRHIAFHAAQAGLHIRDLDSQNGTTLNGFLLNPKMLYKVNNGDVLVLGQLRIVLERARPSIAPKSREVARARVKPDAPKATRNAVQRAIDYFRNVSDKQEALDDLEESPTQESMDSNSIASENVAPFLDAAPTDSSLEEVMYKRTTQEIPRLENARAEVLPPSESRMAPATKLISWVLLLGIGAESLQDMRIEVDGQLTIGYDDFATGIFAELNLGSLKVQELGVSHRHAVLQVTDWKLYIRDLGSLNGTVLDGMLLDPKKLYRVREGGVIELGRVRIVFKAAYPSTSSRSITGLHPSAKLDTPKTPPIYTPPFPGVEQRMKRDIFSVPTESSQNAAEESTVPQGAAQSAWSLKEEVNKRKTQEIPAVQIAQPRKPAWAPRTPTKSRPAQNFTARLKLNRAQQRILRVMIAVMIPVVIVTFVSMAISSPPAATPTPVSKVIPVVKASDAFNYFRKVGLLVSNFQVISAPNTTWAAKEEIRFDVEQGNNKGGVLILTYDSSAQAASDASKAAQLETLKKWKIVQASNFLVVSFPDTPPSLTSLVVSNLKQYLTQLGIK